MKNSVYVLPNSDDGLEDFEWLAQEIRKQGGEATICEARFVDGVTDGRLIDRFKRAREADYRDVEVSAKALLEVVDDESTSGGKGPSIRSKIQRLSRRLEDIVSIDYFDADGRLTAAAVVERVAAPVAHPVSSTSDDRVPTSVEIGGGRTWVTRAGVKVDRIASAWLIRRFIDPTARFVFTTARNHPAAKGELRFDMFGGEYTHVGDSCTFESLLVAFRLSEPALVALGEIVHDIDCKDEKFGRPEGSGVATAISGLVARTTEDAVRLERGGALFDDLYEHFQSLTT